MPAPQQRPRLYDRLTRRSTRCGGPRGRCYVVALVLALAPWTSTLAVGDVQYLRNQLATIPEGGWVQVNKNKFPDAWTTGPDALPDGSYSWPAAVVRAWSSFAWDSNRGNLLLFGGGHANYMGNEMYVWQGSNGLWTRGSVPSRVVPGPAGPNLNYIVDNAAPQSAHTYDNNIFAPLNDLFFTFGGSVFESGGVFTTLTAGGTAVRAGPWAWDPRKADPTKVGGTTGSGYNPSTLGGQMWSNQQGKWTGQEPLEYIESNTAYRQENGHDVLYVTGMLNQSGWQSLYRYELGDVRAGQNGRFEKVAGSVNAPSLQATGTIDTWHSLYIRTSYHPLFPYALGIWELNKASAANPILDIGVELVQADGSAFPAGENYGMDFDDQTGKIVMWDGSDRGTIWETEPMLDAAGNVEPVWLVTKRPSTSFSQPNGKFGTGVLGKFHYVAELGAYIALDEWNGTDSGVWLYKPYGWHAVGGTNVAPKVGLTAPGPGSSFASPASITITANATDSDGRVTHVDFYVDQTLVGAATGFPFSIASVSIAPGVHALSAKAFDDLGASATSLPVTVSSDELVLATSANPALSTTPLTLTAQVIGNAPTGTVAFADAGQPIGGCTSIPLAGSGNTKTAACLTSQLAVGVHSIRAVFGGDSSNVPVTNAVPLSQVIGAAAPPPPPAPLAPTGVSASDGTSTMSVTVTWNASSNATSYTVYRSTAAGTQGTPIGTPTGGTTLSDTTAVAGTTYYYGVMATGRGGTSALSAQDSGFANAPISVSLVDHYYQSILGRAPDSGGKAFWENEVARMQGLGVDVREVYMVMAGVFFSSPEYASLRASDTRYVTDLYNTFFNRAPDAAGLAYWTQQIAAGVPRNVVLDSFLFSPEFSTFMSGLFGNTTSRAEVYAVVDYYRGFLNRLPDTAGFNYWLGQFHAAQCSGTNAAAAIHATANSISSQFISSAEYAQRNRSNTEFVSDLYYTFLRRGGDLAGVSFWINQLDSGAEDRETMRREFIDSSEFNARISAIIAQGC